MVDQPSDGTRFTAELLNQLSQPQSNPARLPKVPEFRLSPTKRFNIWNLVLLVVLVATLLYLAVGGYLATHLVISVTLLATILGALIAVYVASRPSLDEWRRGFAGRIRGWFWGQLLGTARVKELALTRFYHVSPEETVFGPLPGVIQRFPGITGSLCFDVKQQPVPAVQADRDRIVRVAAGRSKLWDTFPIYRAGALRTGANSTTITFVPGRYFDYLGLGQYLEFETDSAICRVRNIPALLSLRLGLLSSGRVDLLCTNLRLPARKYHAPTLRDLSDPDKMCLKLGISNVTLLRNDQGPGYLFLWVVRSHEVAEAPGEWHVSPAGTFEPGTHSEFYSPFSANPLSTVLREFWEECFAGDRSAKDDQHPPPTRDIFQHAEIATLLDSLREQHRASWEPTGIGIDIRNSKVEMTSYLLVHDATWLREFRPRFQSNWETAGPIRFSPFSVLEVTRWIKSNSVTPVGRVAMARAAEALQGLLLR